MILKIIFAFSLSAAIAAENPLTSCDKSTELILTRTEFTNKIISSLDSLLGTGKDFQEPIEALFQIDLEDDVSVKKRVKEIGGQLTADNILKGPEFSTLSKCGLTKKDLGPLLSLRLKLNQSKLTFLQKAAKERADLVESYERQRKTASATTIIDAQIESAKEVISNAESENLKSESSDTTALPEDLRIAGNLLNGIMTDNEKTYLSFLDLLKQKTQFFKEIEAEASPIKAKTEVAEIQSKLEEIRPLWRKLVDELGGTFPELNSFNFEEIPEKLNFTNYLPLQKTTPEINQYFLQLSKAKRRSREINKSVTYHIEEVKKDSFNILNDIGGTRSELIILCDDHRRECKRKRGVSQNNIDDFIRELHIIPLKIEAGYAAKWFEVKRKSNMGIDGWIDLAYQLLILLILVLLPWILSLLFDSVTKKLTIMREEIIAKSVMDYRQRTTMAVWIARILPFLTPTCMLIMTFFAKSLILLTDFPELASLIFFLQIYYCYRLTRIVFRLLLNSIFSIDLNAKVSKSKISIFARKISRYIYVEISILHLIADTAREALVYQLVSSLVIVLNLIIIFKESYAWKEEVTLSFAARFPSLWTRLEPKSKKNYFFFSYPLLLSAVLIHEIGSITYSRLSQFDFAKRLLSEILRKKLEIELKNKSDEIKPSPEYLQYFDYYLPAQEEIYISRESSLTSEISEKITLWFKHATQDDLIVVVGNRGMGKTTTLQRIFSQFKNDHDVHQVKVPAKILGEVEFYEWISSLFDRKVESINDFMILDSELIQKKVLIVDDIQSLFLSTIGGFGAYETFTEIIGLKTKNIFWCLSVNSRSWAYLKGVYGKEHFYGQILQLTPWKDFEIQNLIVSRHDQSKYKRTFDQSMNAFGTKEGVNPQTESQFFRLLWGQSRGNPRSAMMYWISALSQHGPDVIRVGVPAFVDSGIVEKMSDEGHFLLASIARHESLTFQELILVTGISSATIRKCLKEFDDKNLTWIDEHERIRISSKSQYVIDYFLIGKNFLYE